MPARVSPQTAAPPPASFWRGWVMILVLAGITTIAVPFLCYAEHGVDEDCAVCPLRTQPFAASAIYSLVACADHLEAGYGPLSAIRPTRPVSVVQPRGPPRA